MVEHGVQSGDISYQNLMVLPFHNTTLQPTVEVYATKAWRNEAIQEETFALVDDTKEADLLLKGEVSGYGNDVLSLDAIGSATEYRLRLQLRYTLIDNVTGHTLFTDTVAGSWDYKYGANTIDNDIRLRDALENLNKELAHDALFLIKERVELLGRKKTP